MIAIYKNQDGSCGALIRCDHRLTMQQLVEKDAPKNPDGSATEFVSSLEEEIPDLYFLPAFSISNKKVSVDINKAKEVQLNRWRGLRAAKLTELDLESLKAIESGNAAKQSEVTARKNALRDVTKLPLPNTLAEIKNYIPEILK